MAGTVAGGLAAARTNKERYGSDFYAKIGRSGGRRPGTGGFADEKAGRDGLTGKQRARAAGAVGGRKSRLPKTQ